MNYKNKSGIMRNFEVAPSQDPLVVSPHWPGVGRYLGLLVDNKKRPGFLAFWPPNQDVEYRSESQNRRVYGDEIELDTKRIFNKKMRDSLSKSLEALVFEEFKHEVQCYEEIFDGIPQFSTKHKGN